MSSSKGSVKGFVRIVIPVVVLVLATAVLGASCGRAMRDRDYNSLMEGMLPRGPVPPSGPSLCHNRLTPFRQKQLEDYYIICP
ncbi:hypothetical protein L484_009960 [Morus notabilis]|uniref:Uncharacterized protein n=1 Tax=Morus notabilis TaxID=981085 RepID=W9RSJ4_9ROSA|nr:hypothetical protein L484_009960 [Morus notabilis]